MRVSHLAVGASLVGMVLCCARQTPDAARAVLTMAVERDGAGRHVTRIDSLPSEVYLGGLIYIGAVEPESPHAAETVVAFRDPTGSFTMLGMRRTLPSAWPPWQRPIAHGAFVPACEELFRYFILADKRGVLRIERTQDIPFVGEQDLAILRHVSYAVVDTTDRDLSGGFVSYIGYNYGDLYRLRCRFRTGEPPRVSADLLAEHLGGVTIHWARSPLRDLLGQ